MYVVVVSMLNWCSMITLWVLFGKSGNMMLNGRLGLRFTLSDPRSIIVLMLLLGLVVVMYCWSMLLPLGA